MLKQQTKVEEVSVTSAELEEMLGTPGAENITTGSEKQGNESSQEKSFFSRGGPDLSFIDKAEKNPAKQKTEESDKIEGSEDPTKNQTLSSEELEEVVNTGTGDTDSEKNPPLPKGFHSVLGKLAEKNAIALFEDDKPLEDYTEEDVEELILANINNIRSTLKDEIATEIFDEWPEEMQRAANYVAHGGKDMKTLFKALSMVEETKALDPEKDTDQEAIVSRYLTATKYGTPEEVQEEITALKDRGDLGKKAKQFKPKLDQMNEEVVNQQLQQQEDFRKKQIAAQQVYVKTIGETLGKGKLGELPIDSKTQEMLFDGLVKLAYPSVSGKMTNLFGHLIEKYSYREPNPERIAEALWLLADRDGFIKKLTEKGSAEQVEKTVRLLKTEQGKKTTGGSQVKEDDNAKVKKRTIQRQQNNFFKRD
jgi:hypothetical protein